MKKRCQITAQLDLRFAAAASWKDQDRVDQIAEGSHSLCRSRRFQQRRLQIGNLLPINTGEVRMKRRNRLDLIRGGQPCGRLLLAMLQLAQLADERASAAAVLDHIEKVGNLSLDLGQFQSGLCSSGATRRVCGVNLLYIDANKGLHEIGGQ